MKKIIILLTACLALTACYEDFIRDYDHSAIYTMYQYDLRTFILGEEDLEVSFTAALAGVINNEQDRSVKVSIDNSLLSSDLSVFSADGSAGAFTALDGLTGKGKFGATSQAYVTNEVRAAGIEELTPLPESYYSVSPRPTFALNIFSLFRMVRDVGSSRSCTKQPTTSSIAAARSRWITIIRLL